jgi:hypothetical protein
MELSRRASRIDDEEELRIHEVHYEDDGQIYAWSSNEIAPRGYDSVGLQADLQYMIKALQVPTLNASDLPGFTPAEGVSS